MKFMKSHPAKDLDMFDPIGFQDLSKPAQENIVFDGLALADNGPVNPHESDGRLPLQAFVEMHQSLLAKPVDLRMVTGIKGPVRNCDYRATHELAKGLFPG
jgi:hypothetical protein